MAKTKLEGNCTDMAERTQVEPLYITEATDKCMVPVQGAQD